MQCSFICVSVGSTVVFAHVARRGFLLSLLSRFEVARSVALSQL